VAVADTFSVPFPPLLPLFFVVVRLGGSSWEITPAFRRHYLLKCGHCWLSVIRYQGVLADVAPAPFETFHVVGFPLSSFVLAVFFFGNVNFKIFLRARFVCIKNL
jgi:hypothetical protein